MKMLLEFYHTSDIDGTHTGLPHSVLLECGQKFYNTGDLLTCLQLPAVVRGWGTDFRQSTDGMDDRTDRPVSDFSQFSS